MVKGRRTQSMGELIKKSEIAENRRPASPSASSSSSASSVKVAENEPSTSAASNFKEIEMQPLIENIPKVRFASSPILTEAEARARMETIRVNPERDGVYAQVRQAILHHAASAVIGGALGAGGVLLGQQITNQNHTEASIYSVNGTAAPETSDDDDANLTLLSNPIG